MSEVVRIGSTIIVHPSKLWKARFSILCGVLILVKGFRRNLTLFTLKSERSKVELRQLTTRRSVTSISLSIVSKRLHPAISYKLLINRQSNFGRKLILAGRKALLSWIFQPIPCERDMFTSRALDILARRFDKPKYKRVKMLQSYFTPKCSIRSYTSPQ